jgi:hypothetical protein
VFSKKRLEVAENGGLDKFERVKERCKETGSCGNEET